MEFGVAQLSGDRSLVLAKIVKGVGGKTIKALEVGSYEGGSAVTISHAIGEKYKLGAVTCIDPWKPYLEGHGGVGTQMDSELASGAVFERFKRNITHAHEKAPISYYVGTLREVLPLISKQKFDLIFIDGAHSYEPVFEDLRLAAPLLRKGGILCGDDLETQSGDITIEAAKSEWNGHCHPGVTKAVWDFFGRTIWAEHAVWAVRKKLNGWEDFNALP
jgi:hypothetical protein